MVDYLNELLAPGTAGYQTLVVIQGLVGIGACLFSLRLLFLMIFGSRYAPSPLRMSLRMAMFRVRTRFSLYETIDDELRKGHITKEQAVEFRAKVDRDFARP